MAEDWHDEWLPASLAGVPFSVDSVDGTPGRRLVIQEYPGTDFVRGQDLGPRAKRFKIQAYLAGRGYHKVRNRLEAVFDSVGPHLLVHPYRGRFEVYIEGEPVFAESKARGGYCSVTFSCVRVTPDAGAAIRAVADQAEEAVAKSRSVSVAALADQVRGLDTSAGAAAFVVRTAALQRALASSMGAALVLDAGAASVGAQINAMTSQVAGLVSTPASALNVIASTVRAVLQAPLSVASSATNAYADLTTWQRVDAVLDLARRYGMFIEGLPELAPGALLDPPPNGQSFDDQELRNARALVAVIRAEAAATVVETARTPGVESTDQADRVREALERLYVGASDGDPDGLLYAVDPDTFAALEDLRAAALRLLATESADLPTVQRVVLTSETNAISLAQALYGDASRYQEIVDRNALSDPGLIPAGTTIEYLAA